MICKQIDGAQHDARQPGWVYPASLRVPEVAFSVGDDDSCMIVINEKNMPHLDLGAGFVFGAIQENPAYEGNSIFLELHSFGRSMRFSISEENDLASLSKCMTVSVMRCCVRAQWRWMVSVKAQMRLRIVLMAVFSKNILEGAAL
jgi:hypothetical protein